MLERDYISRLLRDFTEALEKLLEKRKKLNESQYQVEIQSMYRSYFNHPANFYYEQDADYIINELGQSYQGENLLTRIDMLSELIYNDAMSKDENEKKYLLNKVLGLISFLDTNSNTFSFERRERIKKIKSFLDI